MYCYRSMGSSSASTQESMRAHRVQMCRWLHNVNMKSCNTHCNTHCNTLQHTVKHGSLPSEPRRKNVSAQVKNLHTWLAEALPLATPPRSPPLHTHTHTHAPPLLNHNLSQVELLKSQALDWFKWLYTCRIIFSEIWPPLDHCPCTTRSVR